MHFWKSYICSNKLDVQGSKLLFRTVQQNLKIISLDTGLRSDRLPALELWDLIVSVFGSMTQTSDRTGRPVDTERSQKISRENQRAEEN